MAKVEKYVKKALLKKMKPLPPRWKQRSFSHINVLFISYIQLSV